MSSTPRDRRRWTGFSGRADHSRRDSGHRGEISSLESGSKPEFARQDRIIPVPTLQSENDSLSELMALKSQHLAALERQQEEAARRPSQGPHDNIVEENLALEMKDVSLDNLSEDVEGKSRSSSFHTAPRARSPPPFHGVLELGRTNGMASSTFLEDSCRHRPDFLDHDPDLDVRSNDSDYDILMHSDVWSETDAATLRRAQRSRFPPPFRHIHPQTQQDNRPTPLSFDDMETLHVPSNPSSPSSLSPPGADQWDGWFLSDTPSETYAFERDYPSAAPLLRKIKALPRNKKVELMTAAAAGRWRELASGLDKAVRMGRLVIDGVAWNARDLREIAEERVLDWAPGLFEAMWNLATGPFLP